MHLQFYGAAGEVTGSCHIVEVAGRRLLLDCGMIQGGDHPAARNREPFPFEATSIDAVVLSHAHIDHCGRLPLLLRRGYRGPIHATAACRDLARILLLDSAHLAQRDAERALRRPQERRNGRDAVEPLFTVADAEATLRQFVVVPDGRAVEILPGVGLTLLAAGHILGSASAWLDLEEAGRKRRLVFSGDIGQYDSPILHDPALAPDRVPVDVVVMESTYGDRRHRERADTLEEFGRILCAGRGGGNVLMPAFAVGRTQEILYELATHFAEWGVGEWRIYLDSPMAIEASEIYWRHRELYDDAAMAARNDADRLPLLPNLVLCRTADESQAINRQRAGAIVIAGSGMCTGGRIVHHLKHNLARPECSVIFTGFQAVGTLGRAIVERREFVRIHGEEIRVAAAIHTLGGFSAHGDRDDLLRWHDGLGGARRTFLVHGEATGAVGLRDALRTRGVTAEIARLGQRVDLAETA